MSADIDDTDRLLVDALLENGRASASELAEEVNIATATATKRLQHLEETGVIDGYQPAVNYHAFGYEVTGSHDVVAIGKFESTEAMNAQIKDVLTHPDIRSARTSVVLDTVCESDSLPVTDVS